MAIREFGQSLLGDVRERKDQQAQDARDYAKKQDRKELLTIGGAWLGGQLYKAASSSFQAKNDAFMQNENILSSKTRYKAAVKDATTFRDQQKLISESGQTGTEYFMAKMRPAFKEKSLEYVSPKISGDERLFNQIITKNLLPLAEKQAKEHEEGLLYASNIGTYKDFDASVRKKTKGVKPQNLVEAATSKAMQVFSGTTEVEQEAEVVSAIQKGPMSKSADAMIAFNERYKETQDAVMAYDYANLIASEDLMRQVEDESPNTSVETTEELEEFSGEVYVITSTKTTDPLSGKTDTKQTYRKDTTFDNPKTASKELAKSMQSTFNLATQPLQALTPSAYANYVKEAQNKGLDIMNSTDPLNYTAVAAIYTNYAANKNNLKDDFKSDVFVATMSEFVKESESLDILLASLENIEDPTSTKYQEALEQIKAVRIGWATTASQIAEVATQVAQGQQTVPPDYGAGTVLRAKASNVHNLDQDSYDSLTPAGKTAIDAMTPSEFAARYK